MNNYGFNNSDGATGFSSSDAWPITTKENKGRNNPGFPGFGMPGRRDMPGNGLQRTEGLPMQGHHGMDKDERIRELEHQFLEVGHGPKVHETPFWLDVVPGV